MPIGRNVAVNAVLRGISAANVKYEKMTRGSWLIDSGAEGFMVAHVAAALSHALRDDGSLLVEAPFKDIREWSRAARRRGRPLDVLRGGRRADIALFDNQDRTTHIIELKRSWRRTGCHADINRFTASSSMSPRPDSSMVATNAVYSSSVLSKATVSAVSRA